MLSGALESPFLLIFLSHILHWHSIAFNHYTDIYPLSNISILMQVASPRIDDEVKIQVDRNVYILNKLFNNIPDVNDAQIQKDVKSMATVQYTIRINDDDPL